MKKHCYGNQKCLVLLCNGYQLSAKSVGFQYIEKGDFRADLMPFFSSLCEFVHISVHLFHTQQGFRNRFMKRHDLGMCAS